MWRRIGECLEVGYVTKAFKLECYPGIWDIKRSLYILGFQ